MLNYNPVGFNFCFVIGHNTGRRKSFLNFTKVITKTDKGRRAMSYN